MAVVVNLTGKGDSGRTYDRGECIGFSQKPFEVDLQGLEAEEALAQVERGEAPLEVLGWVPLMQRGGEEDIIRWWLRLANAEPDPERRGLLKCVLVFAELADCRPQWEKAMEGFDVMRSAVVDGWKAEGETKARIDAVRDILEDKFKALPADLLAALTATADGHRLRQWAVLAARADTLEKFRKEAGI